LVEIEIGPALCVRKGRLLAHLARERIGVLGGKPSYIELFSRIAWVIILEAALRPWVFIGDSVDKASFL
jgi:hypothetical protein